MTEYRVKWCACPHVRNSPGLLFIEAANAEDATKIARDHIERRGMEWFTIQDVSEAIAVPPGRVLGSA